MRAIRSVLPVTMASLCIHVGMYVPSIEASPLTPVEGPREPKSAYDGSNLPRYVALKGGE